MNPIEVLSLATFRRQVAQHEEAEHARLAVLRKAETFDGAPLPDQLKSLQMLRDVAEVEVHEAQDALGLALKHPEKVPHDVLEVMRRLLNLREEAHLRFAAICEKWEKP